MSVDRIIAVESGGNNHARNPRSSAYGPGQFLSGTWMNMIQKHRPDLAQSMSRDQLLQLRSDPTISRAMTEAYANENAQRLKSAGLQDNPGNRYLAHFAGPAGAQSLLEAPRGASAEGILGSQVVAANPFLRGMTAQDVVAWAGRKMGDGSTQPSTPAVQAPQATQQAPQAALAPPGGAMPAPDAAQPDDSAPRELEAIKQQLALAVQRQQQTQPEPAPELRPYMRKPAQFDMAAIQSLLKRRG